MAKTSINENWKNYYNDVSDKTYEELPRIAKQFKLNKVSKVLDYCCGNGRNSLYMAKNGFEVYGFDWSEKALKEAKEKLTAARIKSNLIVWDMFKPLPYKDNSFDAVISIRALYHAKIKDLKRIVKDVARITKPEGYLFLHAATYDAIKYYKNNGQSFKEVEPKTFVSLGPDWKGTIYHCFTKSEIKTIFGKYYKIKKLTFGKRTFDMLAQKKSEIPFYEQTIYETCTAACLLMALVHFKKIPQLSSDMEMKLYKNAIRFPNRYNVAIAAKEYELRPVIKTNISGVESSKWLTMIGYPKNKMEKAKNELASAKNKSKRIGIKENLVKNITIKDIENVIGKNGLPLVVVNAKILGHEEVPHMVVITGLDKNNVLLNDPLSKASTIISKKVFNKAKNFYGDQTLIELYMKK
jgi:ubiquinone/menaquinone biosynthesis C-methylase UbiE